MLEVGLVIGALGALSAAVWAWTALAPDALLAAGLWLVIGGLAFGLPTGLVYHIELHRSLATLGRLPSRWWHLRPTTPAGSSTGRANIPTMAGWGRRTSSTEPAGAFPARLRWC